MTGCWAPAGHCFPQREVVARKVQGLNQHQSLWSTPKLHCYLRVWIPCRYLRQRDVLVVWKRLIFHSIFESYVWTLPVPGTETLPNNRLQVRQQLALGRVELPTSHFFPINMMVSFWRSSSSLNAINLRILLPPTGALYGQVNETRSWPVPWDAHYVL